MSNVETIPDKLAIRETIENYLYFLDAKHWEGVAGCFASDARSQYNFEASTLLGGDDVVAWIRTRLAPYLVTLHALGNLHIVVDRDDARCDSRVTASLLYESQGERRIAVRAIRYSDKLRREGDRWRIVERTHEPLWQYDLPTQSPKL